MRTSPILIAAALVCAAHGASASTPAEVRAAVEKLNPGLKVVEPVGTPVGGLYQVTLDGSQGYVSADGRYFIVGDMYEVRTRRNLAEEARKQTRLRVLKEADSLNAIVFAPPSPKHTITVFTDVDCGFCRKLHDDMAKYNERGLAVRYLAFPRSGPDTPSWKAMSAVWCSQDPRDALTRAKQGEAIERPANCEASNIAAHFALGERVGVQGTPLILLEDGGVIDGYLPPEQLAQRLDARSAQQAATAQRR